jgi:hypothetical protein
MKRNIAVKSSKHGSLKIVPKSALQEGAGDNVKNGLTKLSQTIPQDVTPKTERSTGKGCNYGWKPEYARMQNSYDPHKTWLMTQAKSFLGHDVSEQDAVDLFTKIDVVSRQPIVAPETAPRPSGILTALRALVGVGIALVSISGCARDPQGPAQLESWTVQADQSVEQIGVLPNGFQNNVFKFYDLKERTVCWTVTTSYGTALHCQGMQARR